MTHKDEAAVARAYDVALNQRVGPPAFQLSVDDALAPTTPPKMPSYTSPSPSYTTTSSTKEDYTTGSDDFFAPSSQVLRLDEHDSFLLDDEPGAFPRTPHMYTRVYPLSAAAASQS